MRFLTVTILLLAAFPAAADTGAGRAGMAFLKIGVGARAAAMGDACVSVVDDVTALHWNAGALAFRTSPGFGFMYNRRQGDDNGSFLGTALPAGKGVAAAGISLYNMPGIQLAGDTPEVIGTFSAHDAALTFAYARQVIPGVGVGASVKGLYEKIYMYDALGAALDVGVQGRFLSDRLYAGISYRNGGFTSAMRSESVTLPQLVQAGAAWRFTLGTNAHLLAAADLLVPRYSRIRSHNGLEFRYRFAALRYGYKTGGESFTGAHSFGGGIRTRRLAVDYVFMPSLLEFDMTHRFSVEVTP